MRILLALLLMCNLAQATQGDINGDGLVGLEEAIYALRVTSGMEAQEPIHCDGNPYGGLMFDSCGVCGGDGSTCAGCDGVPNSGLSVDMCEVCGGDNSSCTYDCLCSLGGSNDNCGNCDGGKISISGSISLDNSLPLDFSLTTNEDEIEVTANLGFSLIQDTELNTNYYEIIATATDGSTFRLRLPEDVSSGNIYTNPKISSLQYVFGNFTLYFWDDRTNNNYYSFNNSYCSRMIIEVINWDFTNNKANLSFTSEMLLDQNCM